MATSNNKTVYIAAFVLFLAGFGWLLFSGISQDSVYFVNVSEAMSLDAAKLKQARLFGSVAEQGIEVRSGGLGARFVLLDKDNTAVSVPVEYKGALPDTFKAGVEVIVEGGLDPATRVFKATTLMTKCPSKYEKQREEEKSARKG